MNRKGFVRDLVTLSVFIISISLSIFLGAFVWGMFSNGFKTLSGITPEVTNVLDSTTNNFNLLDNFAPFIMVAFMIASWFFTSRLPSSPVLFWLSLIPIIIVIFFGIIMANTGNEIITNTVFLTQFVTYPKIVWMIRNLPIIILLTASVNSIILYRNKG